MGWIIVLGSLLPIWIGYMVKYKGKHELINIKHPEKVKDKEGYILFMGENLIQMGVVAAIIGLIFQFRWEQGIMSFVPTALVVVVMLRFMKGQKNFY